MYRYSSATTRNKLRLKIFKDERVLLTVICFGSSVPSVAACEKLKDECMIHTVRRSVLFFYCVSTRAAAEVSDNALMSTVLPALMR